MSAKKRGNPRGRHKKAKSPETKRWEQDCLIPPCPPWLAPEMYRKLYKLRNKT